MTSIFVRFNTRSIPSPFPAFWWITAHPGRRRIGAAAGRNGRVCRQCAQGAPRQRRRAHRCSNVVVAFRTDRRAPFRSRRQACRFGPMESSDRWPTIPKSRSPRWRRGVNSSVSGSTWSRPSRSRPTCWISLPPLGAEEMQDDPCHGRLLFSDQGGDLQGRLSPRQDVLGSPRRRGRAFRRRRHGCGSKWTDRQLPVLCRGPHCCAGVHSGAARRGLTLRPCCLPPQQSGLVSSALRPGDSA